VITEGFHDGLNTALWLAGATIGILPLVLAAAALAGLLSTLTPGGAIHYRLRAQLYRHRRAGS
jgi:hypothetical protein